MKVFKNRPRKTCGRQALNYLKWYDLPKADHTPFKFFRGCLPQIFLGPFLNILSHMFVRKSRCLVHMLQSTGGKDVAIPKRSKKVKFIP